MVPPFPSSRHGNLNFDTNVSGCASPIQQTATINKQQQQQHTNNFDPPVKISLIVVSTIIRNNISSDFAISSMILKYEIWSQAMFLPSNMELFSSLGLYKLALSNNHFQIVRTKILITVLISALKKSLLMLCFLFSLSGRRCD